MLQGLCSRWGVLWLWSQHYSTLGMVATLDKEGRQSAEHETFTEVYKLLSVECWATFSRFWYFLNMDGRSSVREVLPRVRNDSSHLCWHIAGVSPSLWRWHRSQFQCVALQIWELYFGHCILLSRAVTLLFYAYPLLVEILIFHGLILKKTISRKMQSHRIPWVLCSLVCTEETEINLNLKHCKFLYLNNRPWGT